eukprot:364432-Chlamydomonas_euryale.AAC.2
MHSTHTFCAVARSAHWAPLASALCVCVCSCASWRSCFQEERQLQLQERIEELEAQAEAMDELDDVPDIPMSDMM